MLKENNDVSVLEAARILLDKPQPQQEAKPIPIYQIPKHVRDQLAQVERERDRMSHLSKWAETVRRMPRFVQLPPREERAFLAHAEQVWKKRVCGNEEVCQVLLSHCVEYLRTGHTKPVLLYGSPGGGKSLIASVYGEMLCRPTHFISAPSACMNRGLAGEPNSYVGAGAGALAEGMLQTKCANPVYFIDEVEKSGSGYSSRANFQEELLTALDASGKHFFDNFLSFSLDVTYSSFIFTANDLERVPLPLLDRCRLMEIQAPKKEELLEIIHVHTLPRLMEQMSCREEVVFPGEVEELLVERLWAKGERSCRVYKDLTEWLVNQALLSHLRTGRQIVVSEQDLERELKALKRKEAEGRKIGY